MGVVPKTFVEVLDLWAEQASAAVAEQEAVLTAAVAEVLAAFPILFVVVPRSHLFSHQTLLATRQSKRWF